MMVLEMMNVSMMAKKNVLDVQHLLPGCEKSHKALKVMNKQQFLGFIRTIQMKLILFCLFIMFRHTCEFQFVSQTIGFKSLVSIWKLRTHRKKPGPSPNNCVVFLIQHGIHPMMGESTVYRTVFWWIARVATM